MLKSNRNLGLSEAMIAAAREILEKKLTPAQEKNIDKNHNGKIDKGDFEILHKKKKMMEAKCPSCGKSPCMCESVKKEEVKLDEARLSYVVDDGRSPVQHDQQMDAGKIIHKKTGRKVYFDGSDMVDHKTNKTITRNALGKHPIHALVKHASEFNEEYELDEGMVDNGRPIREPDRETARHISKKSGVPVHFAPALHQHQNKNGDAFHMLHNKTGEIIAHHAGDKTIGQLIKHASNHASSGVKEEYELDEANVVDDGRSPVQYDQQIHAGKIIHKKTGRKVYFDGSDMVDHKTSKTITHGALGKHPIHTLVKHAAEFKEEVEFSDAELEMIASIAQQHEVE